MEPQWWLRAQELERADRLEEAERAIDEAMRPNLPADLQTAELHRLRTIRLIEEGRFADAAAARDRALRFMRLYVSGSTSGGEAMARLDEAEQFQRELPQVPQAEAGA